MSGPPQEPTSHRLAAGGLIDRDRPLAFRFDGTTYHGFEGDTLASALTANGVRLLGRSFKYHRPRGLLTAGPEEPNGLVELRTGARREPNTRATVAELYDGLEASSQNRWPTLRFDAGAVNGLLSPFLTAGFYYKTFMWPAVFWEKVYEPIIRRAAGLGRAAGEPDPDTYETQQAFCDVLVVGAGPAGLAAALAAGRAGARVILCEDDFRLGGRLLSDANEIDGIEGAAWASAAEAELAGLPEVRVLRRTTVFGVYDGGVHGALERVNDHLAAPPDGHPRQRLWKIVARRTVLASGALERPLVFGGNDRPGVMTASAVRSFLNRFAAAPGRRAAVFTTTDDGWRTAFDLARAGVAVEGVIDARGEVAPGLVAEARLLDLPVFLGAQVEQAWGAASLRRVAVRLASGERRNLRVDLLAVSGGWNPQMALASHLGDRPRWSDEASTFMPGEVPPGMAVAGAAAGVLSLGASLAHGAEAGRAAAEAEGFTGARAPKFRASDEPCASTPLWPRPGGRGKAFIDFQNDVTVKDVDLAVREGFHSVEHVKRYTTLGMATDQGKTSNVNGHALVAAMTGRTMADAGSTISRPPHLPIALGALGGSHRGSAFRPARLTPAHAWSVKQGAVFTDSGQWKRAAYFPHPGDGSWMDAMIREVKAVRSGVGVCDVSTLGKIDVQGPDAAKLLDRVYTNLFSSLPVGRARYGLMLREDGLLLDDGTTARLGPDRYVMSTTTANAARVMQHLDYGRQVIWPELDVQCVSVTEQWAQFAVAGPRSRELMQALMGEALDLSDDAFPYMAAAEAWLGEVTVRVFRLSFSGERAYEIAVPAQFGDALAGTILLLGRPLGLVPYGLEALGVMRIEKGHAGGGELNGQTTARDLGLGGMLSKRKDFIGRTLSERPGLTDSERPTLVGLKAVMPGERFRAGAAVLPNGAKAEARVSLGHVTSAAFSPTLESWIGLGLVRGGPERRGEVVRAYDPVRGGDSLVEICAPVFVDPQGARLRG